VLNDASVAVELDASLALCGATDLLPLGGESISVDIGEGHAREGHGAWGELRAVGNSISFQGGIDAGEDASPSRAGERSAVASDARVNGEIGASGSAGGLNRSLKNVTRSESLDGVGVVGSSRGTTIPRGE